jgi:hypothetical protein
MKTQTLTPILVVIILLVESIFSASLAANYPLSQQTLTDSEIIANQEGASENSNDSDQCDPEQVDCGKIQSNCVVLYSSVVTAKKTL